MNIIEKTLRENIKNQKARFVFPTQMAADLWADKIITVSDVTAVAMDRFLAWDTFKSSSIKSKQQNKTSIPSAMREIFADSLIKKNAETPFLKNLIVPDFAKTASGFTNWICSILPSLSSWKKYFEKNSQNSDDQDLDLLEIYNQYSDFLNAYNFFDPAWETPPFESDGYHYFIFFPDILSDYFEYEQILKQTDDITIISFESFPYNDSEKTSVNFFSNSRIELKNIANHIRQIHQNPENPIPWTDIAVSVPDIETYGAYVERELELYEIPHLMRNATPLSSTGAGVLFDQIKQCAVSDFSYESIKTLLLNSELPWKDKNAINQLLAFGQKNHCICSFCYGGQNIDVWEKSFAENPREQIANNFYQNLKRSIKKLTSAKSFKEVQDFYFEFRSQMFNMELCSKKSDLILSRCIAELGSLLDLESDFLENKDSNYKPSSYFNFFVNYISQINYLEQTDELGVQILPYKLAATAPFACHIILDSSQTSLSVIYKQLSFLQDDKRKKLIGREDPNVTEQFIKLYSMNSYSSKAYFTAAQKTFSGYAQTSSYLQEVDFTKETDTKKLFGDNFYQNEKHWILDDFSEKFPENFTEIQKNSFNSWIFNQNFEKNHEFSDFLKDYISHQKLKFSHTMIKNFNECPRIWCFKNLLKLQEENNAAELMDKFQEGNLYHKIFELYCDALKKNNLLIYVEPEGFTEQYKQILEKSIVDAIENWENPYITKQLLLTTKPAFEKVIVNSVYQFSKIFEGCQILDNEGELNFSPENSAYSYTGRIDCLLKNPANGEIILVDFKTSAGGIPSDNFYATPDNPEQMPDFQIPMYVYLLRKNKNIKVDNACFFNVKEAECVDVFGEDIAERVNHEKDIVTAEEFEQTISVMLDSISTIAERIFSFDFSTNPEIHTYIYCAGCSYNSICRKTFNISKKD